jgi:hypothetical protein
LSASNAGEALRPEGAVARLLTDVLPNAPDADKDAGLFKVPRVITHGG